MRIFFRVLIAVVLICLAFVAYTLISTGYFRTIENKFEGKLLASVELPGVEDLSIAYPDSFAILSSMDRRKMLQGEAAEGGLYYLDLRKPESVPVKLTSALDFEFKPHGISLLKEDSTYLVAAISHSGRGHTIDLFRLDGMTLSFLKSFSDEALISPNDLLLVSENTFYFTNDHGNLKGFKRFLEDFGGFPAASVVYFNGENYETVAESVSYANGINFDQQKKYLFVASTRAFRINVYKVEEDGKLDFLEAVPCKTGVDNIERAPDGSLWIGAHPSLLRFASYAKGEKEISPSEILILTYPKKGEYTLEQVYLNDGSEMSGCSVAAPFGNLILMGNVMDDHYVILEN